MCAFSISCRFEVHFQYPNAIVTEQENRPARIDRRVQLTETFMADGGILNCGMLENPLGETTNKDKSLYIIDKPSLDAAQRSS